MAGRGQQAAGAIADLTDMLDSPAIKALANAAPAAMMVDCDRIDDARTPSGRKGRRQRQMIKVKARGNESVQQMLRRFKKMCEKEGLTKDIKRNSYYEKPSERRRRRMRKSLKRTAMGI